MNPFKAEIAHVHAKIEEITDFAKYLANQKCEDTTKILKKQQAKYNEILQENKIFKLTVQEMDRKITELSNQHNDLEQYAGAEYIEIQDISPTQR